MSGKQSDNSADRAERPLWVTVPALALLGLAVILAAIAQAAVAYAQPANVATVQALEALATRLAVALLGGHLAAIALLALALARRKARAGGRLPDNQTGGRQNEH